VDGETLPLANLGLLGGGAAAVRLASSGGARCVLIGGAPLDGHRYLYWNFVSSRKERLVQAAADWEADRFPTVPGDAERIPLPQQRPSA